jgi:hypothetical protein
MSDRNCGNCGHHQGELKKSLLDAHRFGYGEEGLIDVLDEAIKDFPSTNDPQFLNPYYTMPVLDWEKLGRACFDWKIKWFGMVRR